MPDPTAEQLARESGEAIANALADNIERVLLGMVDHIATLQVEQAAIRDELHTLTVQVVKLKGVYNDHLRYHGIEPQEDCRA